MREPGAVHILAGRAYIDKQTGEECNAQMGCNSHGHCSSSHPPKGNKTGFDFFFPPLVTRAHLEHPLDFIWDPQFGFGFDHLVDLIPDKSLAASLLFSPLVINLNKFKLPLFSSRGTVLYLLLYKSALAPSTSFTLSFTHTILT